MTASNFCAANVSSSVSRVLCAGGSRAVAPSARGARSIPTTAPEEPTMQAASSRASAHYHQHLHPACRSARRSMSSVRSQRAACAAKRRASFSEPRGSALIDAHYSSPQMIRFTHAPLWQEWQLSAAAPSDAFYQKSVNLKSEAGRFAASAIVLVVAPAIYQQAPSLCLVLIGRIMRIACRPEVCRCRGLAPRTPGSEGYPASRSSVRYRNGLCRTGVENRQACGNVAVYKNARVRAGVTPATPQRRPRSCSE
jgi:hypothetical protein